MTFQGRCTNSQGRCKTISGGGGHLPSKSGHAVSRHMQVTFLLIKIIVFIGSCVKEVIKNMYFVYKY
jgi:hypothetical protein